MQDTHQIKVGLCIGYRIDDPQTMSNELLTLIVLQTAPGQDQMEAAKALLSERGLATILDQTFINTEHETISIETIRDLIGNLSFATQEQSRVVVLLAAEKLSLPAQQAMLKTLEEPPARTLITLVTTQPRALLPTILSRCLIIKSKEPNAKQPAIALPEVLKSLVENPGSVSFSQCIDLAEQYKDRGEAVELINNALESVHGNLSIQTKRKTGVLQELVFCLEALQRNAIVQLTLEHCFFALAK